MQILPSCWQINNDSPGTKIQTKQVVNTHAVCYPRRLTLQSTGSILIASSLKGNVMKKILLAWSLLASASVAMAQDVYVVNVQPRFITVQQQQCHVQEFHRESNTGSGTVGAVAGGLLGSTLGSNRNDQLAGTVIGALIGGAIGNEVGREPTRIEHRQVCRYIPVQVQQGEIVTFNYRGRMFTQTFNSN